MTRLSAVVACVVALGGVARADGIGSSCPGLTPLPWPGTTAVPVNAKLWLFGEVAASFTLTDVSGAKTEVRAQSFISDPLVPVTRATVSLRPNTKYHAVLGHMTTDFVTGTSELSTPPPAPTGVAVDLTVAPAHRDEVPLAGLWITGQFAPITPIAHVVVRAGGTRVELYVPVAELKQLVAGLDLPVGPATVEVESVDLAGNTSEPVIVKVVIAVDPALDDTFCYGPRRMCGIGPTMYIAGVAVLVALALVMLLVAALRRLARMKDFGDSLSLLAAEAALRSQLSIVLVTVTAEIMAAITASVLDHELIGAAIASFAAIDIITSIAGRTMLRMLERHDAVAELRGHYLVVVTGRSERAISLSRRARHRANRADLPTSRLNR